MSARRKWAIGVGLFVAALSVSGLASAQDIHTNDWRRRERRRDAPPPHRWDSFTFELRFGAYYPQIDEEFSGPSGVAGCNKGPYECFFGKDAKFYFGLELDWTPLRIPYIGKIGPAFGWGIVTMNGSARDPNTNKALSDQKTSLTIYPMHVSAALRIDEISRRTIVPIVPYVKGGLGFGIFNTGTSGGTSRIDPNGTPDDKSDDVVGEGLSIGPHLGLGGMLGLNWIGRTSSRALRETAGVDQAYLFAEWMWTSLSYGIRADRPGMHIGTSTWVVGLALDM